MTVHEPQQFYIGDTWELEITCHDGDGQVLDLSTASEIEWKLEAFDGNEVAVLKRTEGEIVLSTDGTDGLCVVTLSAANSAKLAPGFYRDQLRVTFADMVTTQTTGRIEALETI